MTTCIEIRRPLLQESADCYWHFFPGQRQRNPYHVKLSALAFSLLLLWQLVGAFLYMVRDVACFRDKSTAYQCKTDAAFPFSEDVTMVWLASLCIFTAISIAALQNVPQFPGYKAILHRLKYVPSFWTLIILLTVALFRYVKLLISIKSLSSWVVIVCLIVSYILRTFVVGFLNYTRLNSLKQKYPIYIFVISKLTVFLFFIVTFINLMATLLALSVEIREMHKTDRAKNSLDLNLDTVNELLEVFGTTTFRIKLMKFFWEKFFVDDRNILCFHIPLEWERQRKSREFHSRPQSHSFSLTLITWQVTVYALPLM